MPSEVATFIPLSVPEIGGNEWKYVKDCLDTGWVSSVGSYVTQFEEMFKTRLGVASAVACANGTSAIHAALLCVGVQPGDEVITSSLTFIAPVNAIRYANAVPVLLDSRLDTWLLDEILVQAYLTERCEIRNGETFNRDTGRRVSAIVPVHLLGHPCNMDALLGLARHYNLKVVEDATESLGAFYQGQPVGTLGDAGCFSFNGNKLITTGGGGMIVTQNPELGRRAKYLTTTAKDDDIEFIHGAIGYNYRLTNLAAALGCAQMERLDEFLAKKQAIAATYDGALAAYPAIDPLPRPAGTESALWLYTIRMRGQSSRGLLKFLADNKVQSRPLWQPNHLSPAHNDLPHQPCPVAEKLNQECLSLPCSVGLSESDQNRVLRLITSYLA